MDRKKTKRKYLIREDDIEENRSKLISKEFIRCLFPSDLCHSYATILVDALNTTNSHLLLLQN